MKITVLNGSPKGDMSVTLQYVRFIEKKFPQHTFKIFHPGQMIQKIEGDVHFFESIVDEISSAHGIIWAFPLYVLLVPAQYKRFIELIGEKHVENAFQGKYASALSTSIHYFDHTAHNYVNAVCEDLGMRYTGFFSADVNDLLRKKRRKALYLFAEKFFASIESASPAPRRFEPLRLRNNEYRPQAPSRKIDSQGRKIILVSDHDAHQINTRNMVERFNSCFPGETETVNLRDLDIKGGCLGCLQCGYDNTCSYGNSDNFSSFYNGTIKKADILVLAGTIKDRYLSSLWKTFFDRAFFNTHIPTLKGKKVGFLISGPLRQIPNLREILEAYYAIQGAELIGIVTDEYEDSSEIDALIDNLAEAVSKQESEDYSIPETFLAVGGKKIFRDDVWGRFRFVFQADHRYYKRHGLYDFPQKKLKRRAFIVLMMLLTRFPRFKKEMYTKRIKQEQVKPLKKLISRL